MEYVSNGELIDYVADTERFNEKLTRHYYKQLLLGLDHFHKNNVYHLDIKMENLILDSNFKLKIIDFGLSVVLDPSRSDEMTKTVGTNGYQPPEMLSK